MPTISCVLPLDPDRSFELLEDPRSLRLLVVGARKIRRFDPHWPEPGSSVDHTVGLHPLLIRDRTEVIACEPGRRLLLDARVQAFGRFSVDFRIHSHPEGSELVVEEYATGGLAAAPFMKQVVEVGIAVRNRELCRRFRRLVERREFHGGELAGG